MLKNSTEIEDILLNACDDQRSQMCCLCLILSQYITKYVSDKKDIFNDYCPNVNDQVTLCIIVSIYFLLKRKSAKLLGKFD